MDIPGTLRSIQTFDVLVVLGLFAMFILGFIQGVIRRLLGLGSILFSIVFAAQVRDLLGNFLATNWTHLPRQYSYVIGFLTVFVAASIAFSLVIQGFYKKQPLFEQTVVVDEILGGLLGIVQGLVIIGAFIVILDPYYRTPGLGVDADELAALRRLFEAYDGSETARIFRETLIPAAFSLAGGLFPQDVRIFFPTGGVPESPTP